MSGAGSPIPCLLPMMAAPCNLKTASIFLFQFLYLEKVGKRKFQIS
jgi:hypothetical protein